MQSTCFLEGDYIQTIEGLYFTVKGFRHPNDRVVAYLRYIPDPSGERVRSGVRYRRVYDLESTTKYLKENYPNYLSYVDFLGMNVQAVPLSNIFMIYKPSIVLQQILENPSTKLERLVGRFTSILNAESEVPFEKFGVSGSLLIGLATTDSDLDLIVYGENSCRRVYKALKQLRQISSEVKGYDSTTVKRVVLSRWSDTGIDLGKFFNIEIQKNLHGYFNESEYFLRLVKIPDIFELYSKPIRVVRGEVTISDDCDSIFTPCRYEANEAKIFDPADDFNIIDLVSFRGKFTEQAKKGDCVEFKGLLEEVTFTDRVRYRVILGGKGDYLINKKLLGRNLL